MDAHMSKMWSEDGGEREMMFFKERNELAKEAEKWIEENGAENSALSVISFLSAMGRLKEERWMPVSRRLPEDGIEVWATIKGHDVVVPEPGETIAEAAERIGSSRWVTRAFWCEEEHGWNDPGSGCPLMVQPIAWMPIDKPEPWEEEDAQMDH